MEASIILDLARGADKYYIECAIELYEEGKRDLDRIGAASRLKNASVMPSKKEVDFEDITAIIVKMNDPALRLLRSLTTPRVKRSASVQFLFHGLNLNSNTCSMVITQIPLELELMTDLS
jgi:hypothetical protein